MYSFTVQQDGFCVNALHAEVKTREKNADNEFPDPASPIRMIKKGLQSRPG